MCGYLRCFSKIKFVATSQKKFHFLLRLQLQVVMVGAYKMLLPLQVVELSFQLPDDASVLLKLSV